MLWNSLRVRLLTMVLAVIAVSLGTVAYLAGQGTASAVNELAAFNVQRDQQMVTALLTDAAVTDMAQFQMEAEQLAQVMNAHIILANAAGVVLVDSGNQIVGQTIPLPPAVGLSFPAITVQDQPAFVFLNYAPPFVATEAMAPGTMVAGAPVIWNYTPADLVVSAPVQIARQDITRSLLWATLAGGGVAVALTLMLSRRIVQPVEALTAAARRLEQGDWSQRVSVASQDEIGTLAHAFNAMAEGLSRTEQLRRQMVGDIAHELRTPLTNLRGYLEAVKDGVVELKPAVVESLHEEAILLNRLVDDLQELALAEAGQLKLEKQPVALNEFVTKTVAALPVHPGPALRLNIPTDLPPVYADPERLRQILRNLIVNAQQHTPPKGEIVVSARAVENQIEISVRDTGAGIAPEHLPFVFERFYRADAARARTTGGAGLGLAIVKQWVEAHGGTVRAESVMREGAAFYFTLPVVLPPN